LDGVTLFEISFHSTALHKQTEVHVLVPAEATRSDLLPVLWTLHGMTDDHKGWLRHTLIELQAEQHGFCVVMPNADLSFYVNMAYGANYQTYIAEELPEFLSRYLPLSRAKRDNCIAGNSMGGYGAFLIAMRNPTQYRAAVSLSGPMCIDWVYRTLSDADLAAVFASGDATAIKESTRNFSKRFEVPADLISSLMAFGDECTTRTFKAMFGLQPVLPGSPLDLLFLARELAAQHEPLKLLSYCGQQDYHFGSNLLFRDLAEQLGLDYALTTGDGAHEWKYWNEHIIGCTDLLFSGYRHQ
jgi:putative tributyrin esterase